MSLARIAGVFYAMTFVTGTIALLARGRTGIVAGLLAGGCYVAVTLLFYVMFRPVNQRVSLIAALISLAGCAVGPLSLLHVVPSNINSLVFFGCYCLLIGYLIVASTFLPRMLGVLMACGGLGWLTFLGPSLARDLSPYNFAAGLAGEGSLTIWLLAVGVRGGAATSWRDH